MWLVLGWSVHTCAPSSPPADPDSPQDPATYSCSAHSSCQPDPAVIIHHRQLVFKTSVFDHFFNSIYTLKNPLHVPHKLICISVLPNIQNLIYRNPSPTRFCERRLSRGRGLHWDPFLHPCRPAATESQSHPGPCKEKRDHPSRPGQGFSPFSLFKIGLIW